MLQQDIDNFSEEKENLVAFLSSESPTDQFPPHWERVQIGQIADISGGSTPSTKVPEYWGGEIPWLTPGEVTACKSIFISTTERYITNEGLTNSSSRLLPVGTVMMTSRATLGEAIINTVPMSTNQGFINIICDTNKVSNIFFAYWIKNNKRLIESRASGVTFKEILKPNFKTIPIALPPLPEQRAIAHVLQTVQNAIQARRKELELERERKAALMQHLFTHGTRNEPTKMSEVGEIPESWEVVKLGEAILDIQYGLSLAGKSTGAYPILRMNNLTEGLVSYDDLQYVELDDTVFQRFKLNKGDLLFNRTNSADLVGKTSLFDVDLPAVFASYLIRIITNSELLRPVFLNWYFNWDIVQNRLKTLASRGVSQSNISASNLQNLKVPIPAIPEQTEIANVFNTITSKIAALEKEITLQEELFRVLLDELMTGRLSTRGIIL